MSVRVVFANRSGFDTGIGVVKAWEERGSCLNIFRTTNRGWISENFTNYEAKDLLSKNIHNLRGKRLVAKVSEVRQFALHMRTGVDFMLQLESSCHRRSVAHVLTYSGQQIAVGSQKPSRITKQRLVAQEERGSCLNIFRTTNSGWIPETFTNYEAKDILQVSETRQFALYLRTVRDLMFQLGSSRHGSGLDVPIGVFKTWEKRSPYANIFRETNWSRMSENFTNYEAKDLFRNGFDVPIGVLKAWEERVSCLNIFQTINRGRISETFMNYEAKGLLRNGFDFPIGVVKEWEERGSCLNIFRTINRGRISKTFLNYEAKDLLRK
ncbi:uncharacterized protein G2W53_021973 [Senna tora]|uniref:Uncharacterized protein n=1 Tax=Senna tora TaxID=362788 RepID=A0A834TTQ7_9FABA|nr:uncharacterized protein G2W53_021973 [Senna tora]